jgi:hypothetical protein
VPRYREASRTQKKSILDEFIASTGYARKYAIRLLSHPVKEPGVPIKRTRKRQYGAELQEALRISWAATNYIGSKRLAPFLMELVPVLERFGHLKLTPEVRNQLCSISPATIDRILHPLRKAAPKGMTTTKSGFLLKKQVPVRTFADWNETGPGFFEGDLVAHCGSSTDGAYLNTLVLTDIATGWVECLPLLYRSQHTVIASLDYARSVLPFPMLGLDTDNGSEFLNAELLAYCKREQITFTRGRAYKKNDQCFVEQKNGVVVRQLVGYDRFEGELAWRQLGELYRAVRLYVNFFQPSMKLHEKHRTGAKVQKIYYPAQTPYQRLQAALGAGIPENLFTIYEAIDPVELLRQIRVMQDALWKHALRVGDPPPMPPQPASLSPIRFEPSVRKRAAQKDTHEDHGEQRKRNYHRTKTTHAPHTWRTREDPFHAVWPEICESLARKPESTAKVLLLALQQRYPDQYPGGQLRTLQRRIHELRAKMILTFDDRLPDEDQLYQGGLPHPLGAKLHGEGGIAAHSEVVAGIAQEPPENHQEEDD